MVPVAAPLAGEALVTALNEYATEHADEYAGMYVDPPGTDSFVMLFTDHLDEHASALGAMSPQVAVRRAEYTERELTAVLEGIDFEALIADGVEPMTAGVDTIGNHVFVELKTDDPTLELRLELAYGGKVDVKAYPLPGPWANTESGPGWRLLAAGQAGSDLAYTALAATDPDAGEQLWATLGLEGDLPSVDFATEVVATFGHGIGSSCAELRLDGVRIEGGVVFSETSDPLSPRACTDDLTGAAVFVVALEREALPDDGFTLQLGPDGTPAGGEPMEVPLP